MNKKDQANRFQGLMGSLGKTSLPNSNPESASSDSEPQRSPTVPVAKSKSKDYQRTTIYLPKALHRKLKAAALDEDREISDIVESLVTEYVDAQMSRHLDA